MPKSSKINMSVKPLSNKENIATVLFSKSESDQVAFPLLKTPGGSSGTERREPRPNQDSLERVFGWILRCFAKGHQENFAILMQNHGSLKDQTKLWVGKILRPLSLARRSGILRLTVEQHAMLQVAYQVETSVHIGVEYCLHVYK